jgi:dihydrofolate reductase
MKLIVAVDNNYGIGKNNQLPWNHKSDLKYFSKLTKGSNNNNCVIMGYNTYNSIGKFLPYRKNIILSKSKEPDNINIFNDINSIVTFINNNNYDDIWVIGGLQIYNLFIKEKLIDEIFITYIDFDYNCDIFFPKLSKDYIEDISYTYSIYDNSIKLTYKKYIKLSM